MANNSKQGAPAPTTTPTKEPTTSIHVGCMGLSVSVSVPVEGSIVERYNFRVAPEGRLVLLDIMECIAFEGRALMDVRKVLYQRGFATGTEHCILTPDEAQLMVTAETLERAKWAVLNYYEQRLTLEM